MDDIFKNTNLSEEQKAYIQRELEMSDNHYIEDIDYNLFSSFYDYNDFEIFYPENHFSNEKIIALKTLDELIAHDKQREKDGFPKRIISA